MSYVRRVYCAIPNALLTQANQWCVNNGYGDGNFTREIILTADSDTRAARAWGCCCLISNDDFTRLKAKLDTMANTYIVDAGRFDSRTTINDFLHSKGFRLKGVP